MAEFVAAGANWLAHHHYLQAILESIQEGIEVVDRNGIVTYINPAFSRITGLPAEARLGKSIFETAPEMELSEVLRTGRPMRGGRTKAKGSEVEVIADASPIMNGGEMVGAVVVIQDVSEVMRLGRDLYKSSAMIENLYDRVGDLARATYTFADLIGSSRALSEAVLLARRAGPSDSVILLMGESGTGKELFAHAIHNASRRRGGPFIKVNCAAIPDQLLESEFFGYEKGAFTGAVKRKLGMFELANHGTIFLDEIGEMTLPLQAKLLRVLQEQEFHRLGGTTPVRINVRVIAATNVDLPEMVAAGRFRRDLYYRLNVVTIPMPPLRRRLEDIPVLFGTIVAKLNRKLGRDVTGLSEEARLTMERYDWPGNVRELENVLERAMHLLGPGERIITPAVLQPLVGLRGGSASRVEEVMPLEEMERQLVCRALERFGHGGEGKRRAAEALGISLATLYNKIKKFGLEAGATELRGTGTLR